MSVLPAAPCASVAPPVAVVRSLALLARLSNRRIMREARPKLALAIQVRFCPRLNCTVAVPTHGRSGSLRRIEMPRRWTRCGLHREPRLRRLALQAQRRPLDRGRVRRRSRQLLHRSWGRCLLRCSGPSAGRCVPSGHRKRARRVTQDGANGGGWKADRSSSRGALCGWTGPEGKWGTRRQRQVGEHVVQHSVRREGADGRHAEERRVQAVRVHGDGELWTLGGTQPLETCLNVRGRRPAAPVSHEDVARGASAAADRLMRHAAATLRGAGELSKKKRGPCFACMTSYATFDATMAAQPLRRPAPPSPPQRPGRDIFASAQRSAGEGSTACPPPWPTRCDVPSLDSNALRPRLPR
jgi:hypothetical protein